MHLPWPYLARPACALVGAKVRGKGFLELKGNTLAHVSDAIDRIDQCFRIGLD
jgi:hypothetical protein